MVLAPEKDVAVGEFLRMLQDVEPLGGKPNLAPICTTDQGNKGGIHEEPGGGLQDAFRELDQIIGRIQALSAS